MLPVSWPDVVLWIHVLAACVWIGGQITIAMLVPVLRGQPDLLSVAGRRYQIAAWFAFAVLIVTGLWNVHNAGISWTNLSATSAGRTLSVKLLFVALSGVAAAVHAFVVAPRVRHSSAPALRALSGILGAGALLAAFLAALYGVTIANA
ncbi:MAG TPA: CopD family protein [Chloroflexota bacterium]|nr:CopD family protein [Chloroflexota bacterium]